MTARRIAAALLLAGLWGAGAAGPARAISDCADAERYLANATNQDREEVLRRIVALCPQHSAALNNLAVLVEKRGDLEEAEALYRRAIDADPYAIAPHAGLGDVLMARQQYGAAVAAYRSFLAGLEAANAGGTAQGLAAYAPIYRERLAKAEDAAAAAGQPVQTADVVSARQILRSLTTAPVRTRGLNLQQRTEPHIDLHIRFDFDSDRLKPDAQHQIDEIASALAENILKDRRILIEGHTDSTGATAYNQSLSERRAAAVRAALLARGVDPRQVEVVGYGESRPIADNETAAGQALNRRVTFVNVGAR